ncbi:hypothetical protein DNTS_025755 [Danionella cerebrum]|uniref:Cadherin domain-containing protein n=1 Tax=Danionella cerebrum TaxID=2873325 RepID=A0A553NRY2_9TELE|nr:hypothetical protein DNTS_025755 [Danionella translucida]
MTNEAALRLIKQTCKDPRLAVQRTRLHCCMNPLEVIASSPVPHMNTSNVFYVKGSSTFSIHDPFKMLDCLILPIPSAVVSDRIKRRSGFEGIGGKIFLRFLFLTLRADVCAQVLNLRLSIEEGLPAKTIVGDLRAAVPWKSQSPGFFISESKDSDVLRDLEIDGDTGIISTAVLLDRERTDRYEFAAATLTGEVIKVTIEVTDVNDHSPVFHLKTAHLNVSELSPPGTRLELEGAQDQDEGHHGTQGYRIIDGDIRKIFDVEIRNGVGMFNLDVILLGKLDREKTDFYNFTIEAFDGGVPPKTGQLQVHVSVLDENDNQPVFNQSEYRAAVLENATTRTAVCQVFATDLDSASNGEIFYGINRRHSDPSEIFVIDHYSGVISINNLLDYENQSFYELMVMAWDSGFQTESSSTFVSVYVLNVNDNHPNISILFLNEVGAPEVSEEANPGDYLARIAVSDPDLGELNQIEVLLQGGDGMFSLKSTDEFLYVLCVDGHLDREITDSYELTITASDLGSPPLSSEVTFQIRVTDVNDNSPVFDSSIYEELIHEDVRVGTALFRVKATDRDLTGDFGIIYTLLQSEKEPLFSIEPTSGLISTATALDHERAKEVTFLVVASDGGSPSLSSTATVSIHVLNVNDNRPTFQQQFYNITVKEHTPVGTCILQVNARDADDETVLYSLFDGFSSKDVHYFFHMNPVTGDICISQDIDHEAGLVTFDMIIKAEDQDGLSSQAFVHINVEDVNDNAPVFNPEKYYTSVSIHTQPGTEILGVLASDRDANSNGNITYELLPGDSASLFTVDQSTGCIFLRSSLTQLRSTRVKLYVSAKDGGGLSANLPANITVNILQTEKPASHFQRAHYSFSISEDAPVGSTVGLVQDLTPDNSIETISYISSGDPFGLFSVDSQTGIITTSKLLDHESLSNVIWNIQYNTGILPFRRSAQVNVSITDVNDNPPVFQKTSEHLTISSNTPTGTPLFLAHADDIDRGLNGKVHYRLHPESHLFTIDSYNGTWYELSITAEDEGDPSLSSTLCLVIEVDSSAEDTVAFENLVYNVEVKECAPKDTRMIQVRAHGIKYQHGGSSQKETPVIIYTLKSLTETLPFQLQSDSGVIFVSKGLDYETEPMYRFCVFAKMENSTIEATATIVITIQDENDNAPVFSREMYFFTVEEGPVPLGLIGTVTATDRDSKSNGNLSFILLSDVKHFSINPRSGEILNLLALDREEQAHHLLRVMVTDQGRPRLNATTTVHIIVTDVNDNSPHFTQIPQIKEINVWGGIPAESVIITMFAKDLDAGENGTVRFFLKDNQLGHFTIDSCSGDVKVTSEFSSNPQIHYTLRVVATDHGLFPLEEIAVLHIQVYLSSDQNENIHSLKHYTVHEDVGPGTIIGSLGISKAVNSQIRYSIVEGDGSLQFGIKSSSGELYVAQHLDYEVMQRYFLVVRTESPAIFNMTVLAAISIIDVNDHNPWFPGMSNIIVFGVQEDVSNGTLINVFNARDGDGSLPYSELYYSLTYDPSIEKPPLHIDPHTGAVTTNTQLDRESRDTIVFTVTASDSVGEPHNRKTVSLTAQIILLDVNDNSPIFISMATAYVPEDAEVGSLVHRVMAKDEDEGINGNIVYRLISGNEDGYFHMESSGHLYLSSSLDYESQHVHILTVQARDSGFPSLFATQMLTVKVVDVNDFTPVFQQNVYNTTVMENRAAGEIVGQVTTTDLDSDVNSAVTYRLLPGPGYDLFNINPNTGQIRTSRPLDREAQSFFMLRVQAEDSGTPSLSCSATVLCSVLDENDNPPFFSQTEVHIVLQENLPLGIIHIARASDLDDGMNGNIEYYIEGDEGYFTIDFMTGAISTTRVLDREERSTFSLLITAADQGLPSLSSTSRLNISLSDENDNSPSFSRKSYRVSISEALPVDSEILHLSAWDPDEGLNGEITFSFEEENSGHFQVDASSGVIRLSKSLDHEVRSQHVLHVIATDGCRHGPRSSSSTVTVLVEDVNDNPPVCTNELFSLSLSSMSTRPSRPIIKVTALDPDQGDNGTLVFSLAEEDDLFQVDVSGEVRLKAPLSPEVSGTKLLRIKAADQGRPSLSSKCLLVIHLNGEDAMFQFTKELYEVSIPENSKTGAWVANVAAHDKTAEEASIKYSIFRSNENEAFDINPVTGDITVGDQGHLDFEIHHKIQLVVFAEKGPKTAYSRLAITLQDVNDNAPEFRQHIYRTAVWEGQSHNTFVMQVAATDSDSGVNGQVSYFIADGNHNNVFVIDPVHGILATNAVLDREIVSSYKLILQAKDMGRPPHTGTCTVLVYVVDVNDNRPTIPSMEPVTIAENLPVGYMVTQVIANDVDLSPLATYRLVHEGDASSFAIDQYSGVITTTKILNYEEQEFFTITVEVSDTGRQTEVNLTIQVLDVNDNPPVFSKESYQDALSEHTVADRFVVTVFATDKDSGQNGNVSYRLRSSPASGFFIDHKNGSVFTNKPLNYVGNGSMLHLLVEARDHGDPSLFSITSVDIEVVDFNDNVPLFTENSYQVNIPEDVSVGSTLITLSAKDKDYSFKNTHLTYAITSGNEENRFCIEVVRIAAKTYMQNVAHLVLCNPLDREGTYSYSLTVTVSDRGTPPLSSSAEISIKVLDINDNAPVFDCQEYHVQVRENSPLGLAIIHVSAHDPDLGSNGTVTYKIISGNSRSLITVNSTTGTIEVNAPLDFEVDTQLSLTIQASDCSSSREKKVSFAIVYILILDENDNSPFFMFPTYNCSVAENLVVLNPVCTVQAVDEDAGSFGLLTYSILGPCIMDYDSSSPDKKEAFGIDPLTGGIYTKQTFDYEGERDFCFVVEARDKGDQLATVRVEIEIEGIDEFSPIFSQNIYHFSLPDNTNVGQSIGQLMAMDHDGGLDGLVEYSLVNTSLFFNVNKTNGYIYITNSVYQRRILNDTMEEFIVQGRSPKLESRSSTCHVIVNISSAPKTLPSDDLSLQIVNLSVPLIVLLILLLSVIALVLSCRSKSSTVQKTAFLPAHLNHETQSLRATDANLQNTYLKEPLDTWVPITNPLCNSKFSSGRSSADTAEDQEINTVPCFKRFSSLRTQQASKVSVSGIPGDSVKGDPSTGSDIGIVKILDSSQSLHLFRDEGGGEETLPRVVNMKEVEEVLRMCMSMHNSQGSVEGSLTNLIYSGKQQEGSNSCDYFINWKPRFKSLDTVFTDLGMLPDEGLSAGDVEQEPRSLIKSPSLITGIDEAGIYTIPPRKPNRTSSKVRMPTLTRPCSRTPELNHSAMTPNFSPALSYPTLQTDSSSPEGAGLGWPVKIATLSTNILDEAKSQE